MNREEAPPLTLSDFGLGRVTAINQATIPPNALLIAENILIHGGAPHKIDGYTKLQNSTLNKVERLYSFERQSDKKQFLVATGGAKIGIGSIDASSAFQILSAAEVSGDFDFLQTQYALYLNNGKVAYKLINIAGVETLVPWGLQAPVVSPTINIGGGTLNLVFGTRYVYCEVFQWTDSVGVTRYHISAPSGFSAHTGALAAKAVTVGNLVPVNANTTHYWIFRVRDSAIDTSGSYFFVAEVPVANNSYVDALTDAQLDTTRSAPFDNAPPPLANIMLEYAGRPALLYDDVIQLGALDETLLGIPYESFPVDLKYTVPGGVKKLTAGIVYNQSLLASTEDFWFALTGTDLNTFSKQDRVLQPGAIGRKLVLSVHGLLVWLGKDKKLWSWTGVQSDDPIPASAYIHAKALGDQLSMDDLSTAYLSQCELQWYSNGLYDFVVLAAPSKNTKAGEKDWIQMWDLYPMVGIKTIQGRLPLPALTDFFPSDAFSTTLVAKSNGVQYLYFGSSSDGSIYRWPDGSTFNGNKIISSMGSPWLQLAKNKCKLYFVKLLTNINEAKDKFQVLFQASKGTRTDKNPVQIELQDDYDAGLVDPTVAKGRLLQPGTAFGNWVKFDILFPDDDGAAINAVEIDYREL